MEMATLLAKEKKININSNLKRQRIKSDRAIVIKKIFMNTPKDMIITIVSRNQFRALLFTLPVDITAHNLKTLLEGTDLVWYKKCKSFGYSALECDAPVTSTSKPSKTFKKIVSDECHLQLTKLYEKKNVLISCSAAFGGKSWAQVVLLVGFSDGFHFASGFGSLFSGALDLNNDFPLVLTDNSSLDACLAFLERFLELLINQVFGIVCKLNNIELVLQALSLSFKVLTVLIAAKENLALDMIVDIF
ncbi:hypothetical protein G9A89_010847 [Geosiphon pyriformis]|nr:hypothetical protein G9A89_010847 [Geosiphon pyriformis]